jgi:molybdopterin-guanine dinucleotide biosynthesis protein A
MSGLLSAWQCDPGVAWLVVACDLAALDRETLEILLQARNPGALATAFRHPDDGVPEPLCALYEPAAQAPIRVRFAAGRRSLRGFLMDALADCRVTLASPPTLAALRSHNEPPPSRGED